MGTLTTHVLDTAQGIPAAGIRVALYSADGERKRLKEFTTNSQGRAKDPILAGSEFETGTFELLFFVAEYFDKQDVAVANPPFLDEVVVRFTMADDDQHYHVPLLVSPWSYSTYRGS